MKTDGGSGWSKLHLTESAGVYTGTLILSQNENILFRVTDNDGNVFTHDPYEVTLIDKNAPTVSANWDTAWTNGAVTINVTATDDLSGVAQKA